MSAVPAAIEPGIALALILLAAIVGSHFANLLRIPRVVGYLVAGLLLRYALMGASEALEGPSGVAHEAMGVGSVLRGVKTLALGLILFSMGSFLDRSHLKSVGARVWRISSAEIICVLVVVAVGCGLAYGINDPAGTSHGLVLGLLLGAVAVATAPAATLLVLREYDAKGHVSDTIMTLTALNNIASIVLFHIFFLILLACGAIETVRATGRWLWLDLLFTTVGSVALGTLLGFVLSVLHAKMSLMEFLLVLLALLLGLGEGAQYLTDTLHLSFNFLLTCLFCGAAFANITVDQEPLHKSLQTVGNPVFAAFFVLAGYELHIQDLGALGWVGLTYVVLRALGKFLGCYFGARRAGSADHVPRHLGLGLFCQAGVAIGLAEFLCGSWGSATANGYVTDPRATQFKTIVLGSVVLFEVVGPLALKALVVASGEVKAVTLLRRRRAAAAEGDSIVRLSWNAMLRTLGFTRLVGRNGKKALQVRHIMRSNIKLLPASAKLDEVLHFVERSRYNHFPVVDEEGHFAGMVRFADLREIIYDPTMRDLVTAIDLANPSAPTVPVDLSLEELLEVFKKADMESLTVVDSSGDRRVVGLVEQRDLLRALHIHKPE